MADASRNHMPSEAQEAKHYLPSSMDQYTPSRLHQQQPTPGAEDETTTSAEHDDLCRHDHEHEGLRNRYRQDVDSADQNISIPASSKHAEQTVAPFLAEHIPMQYNPGSNQMPRQLQAGEQEDAQSQPSNTKFCYRHRPDLKCRRQANEPSMEQLQNELGTLSQSDQQAISHVWSLFSAAPSKHRNLMLQGILTQCCFPQLSYVSATVRDLIKIDFLSALPPELGFKILCYLDTTSLCKAAQVSQRWRSLADDDVVWHKMCEQHIDRKCIKCGWGLPLLERKRLRTEKRQIQLRATGRGLNQWSPAITPIPEDGTAVPSVNLASSSDNRTPIASGSAKRPIEDATSSSAVKKQCTMPLREQAAAHNSEDSYFTPRKRPWKDVYKDRFKVGTAWKYGRCTTKVFKGHTNGVMCLQFDESVLITGSYDATAKVWDIETGNELRSLAGHTSGIRCLQFDDSKLMTGSLDHTIKLWNWRTGQCLRTFNAHTEGVLSLHFVGRYVASGSMDKTVRVWDSSERETFLLRGHQDWVNSVKIDEPSRTLFSASDDLTIRLWDLDTRQCIKVFEGHVGQVQQILPMPAEFELDEHNLHPGDKDDDASSVDSTQHSNHLDRETPVPTSAPFWPSNPDRPAPPRYMLSAALDSTIRIWDVHASPSHPHLSQDPQPLPTTTPFPSTPIITTDHANTNPATLVIPTDPLTNSHIPRNQACVRTFFGHVEGIWALAADHLRLVSGSEDRMMKVWDPRTGKCERTFTGHAGPVTCAWLSDRRVASGSEDCEVRVLDFGDG
ncbi:hypothetical protein MBLNU230_g6970t1 [Neophaeotheca triangularis]